MEVRVKMPDGAEQSVSADGAWSVAKLKEQIAAISGHAPTSQRLTVGGKIMKDAKTLGDYPAAAKQACSLVITGGGDAAAAGGAAAPKKTGDRAAVEGLISEVIELVKKNKQAQELQAKYGDKIPDSADLQEALGLKGAEQVKQRVLDELTRVLEGDWTPFDKYYPPLREYGGKMLDGTPSPEKRDSWVQKASEMTLKKMAEYPQIKEQIEQETKPGSDLVAAGMAYMQKAGRRGIDLMIDGPSPAITAIDQKYALFSAQLRLLVVTVVGGIVDICIDCLRDGEPQCRMLMAKMTGKAVEKFAEKFPDYSQLAAFAGPMAMNQVWEWHTEYLKTIKGKPGLDPML